MTQAQKEALWTVVVRVAPIVLAIGIAWGTLVHDVQDRVTVSRFEAESLRAVYWRGSEDDRLSRMQKTLDKIDDRVSKMFCRNNPNPACQ